MDKSAKELIEKIAKHGGANARLMAAHAKRSLEHAGRAAKDAIVKHGPTAAGGVALFGTGAAVGHAAGKKKKDDEKKDDEKKASMKNIIDDIIKGAEQNTFGRPVKIETNLDKNASELIQKLAISPEVVGRAHAIRVHQAPKKGRAQMAQLPERTGNLYDNAYRRMPEAHQDRAADAYGETLDLLHQKKSSLGTPLDIAKTAGALQALGEQGYSVKQAADYLGLTETQIQDIVALVR